MRVEKEEREWQKRGGRDLVNWVVRNEHWDKVGFVFAFVIVVVVEMRTGLRNKEKKEEGGGGGGSG